MLRCGRCERPRHLAFRQRCGFDLSMVNDLVESRGEMVLPRKLMSIESNFVSTGAVIETRPCILSIVE